MTTSPPAHSRERVGRFLAWRRAGETDGRFGERLALSGPILFFLVLTVGMLLFQVEGEAGLGLILSYWLFIGASQCVYLVPGVAIALWAGQPGIAWGLLKGGGIVALADIAALGVGMWIGPR